MEIWNYLEIVTNKNKRWLFRSENLEERLAALAKISEIAAPAFIPWLTPHLKDRNKEIREATFSAISKLFAKLNSQNRFYNSLKNCEILTSDIDFFKRTFRPDQSVDLLLIASLNRNGHVREKAVTELGRTNSGKAIQFLVYRLADWVAEVRRAALQSIENFEKREHIQTLIENLPVFSWLRKVERVDLSSYYDRTLRFILDENKEYVFENFATFADQPRLLLARYISDSSNATTDEVRLLITDKFFLIRNLAVDHFTKLSSNEIDRLLKDKSSRVRLHLLRKLQNQDDFTEIAYSVLADDSASIRQFARYSLKNELSNFASIYSENLIKHRQVIGSLRGLAETEGREFWETVIPFLDNNKVKIMTTAFLALTSLIEQRAYEFAIANLDSSVIGIRNVIIQFLRKKATTEVLEKAREIYGTGGLDIKKSMLKLFNNIGGWSALPDIIVGTIDDNEEIRSESVRYLERWKIKASRLFTQPKVDDIERAKKIFDLAFEIHESKKYFSENPLRGIGFYLK